MPTPGRTLMVIALTLGLSGPPGALAQHAGGHGHAAPVVLETVTVTAERISEYVRTHPQDVTVLDREEIATRNLRSVEDALNSMPGVEVRSWSGLGSRISIRGSGKTGGVLVLLDGRPLNSSQYGGVDLNTIALDTVKSIAVFKPPAPVWLGPGAGDGAIYITTSAGAHPQEKAPGTTTRIKASAGSYGLAEATVSHSVPLAEGKMMLAGGGFHRDGKRPNSDRNSGQASIRWEKADDGIPLALNARYYVSEHGSPGPLDNPTPDARQRYEKESLDAQTKGWLGDFADYTLKAYGDRTDLTDESQTGFKADLNELKVGLKADATWMDDVEIWNVRWGGILERTDADQSLTGEHHRNLSGLHAQVDRKFGSVTGTLGVRGDYTSDFDVNPGGSAGVTWAWNDQVLLRGLTGYTVNIPTFDQLYQPVHGSIDQVRGNPDLQEENVWSYSLGVEYRRQKDHVFQLTAFRQDTDDLIIYQRGPDLIYRPVNARQAWRQGIEVIGKTGWQTGVTLEVTVILQDSENEDTGQELPNTPRQSAKASLAYTLPSCKTRIETTGRYEGERFSDTENQSQLKLSSYVTLDLKLQQPFTLWGAAWEGWVQVLNLLDQDFEVHYGYPDDGIRCVAGLNLSF